MHFTFCIRIDNWLQFLRNTLLSAKNKNMPAESKHEDLSIIDNDFYLEALCSFQ